MSSKNFHARSKNRRMDNEKFGGLLQIHLRGIVFTIDSWKPLISNPKLKSLKLEKCHGVSPKFLEGISQKLIDIEMIVLEDCSGCASEDIETLKKARPNIFVLAKIVQ